MQKTIKATLAALMTASVLLSSAVFSSSAAEENSNKATIRYSTQKQDEYRIFESQKTFQEGTLTADVGDVLEVTVYAKSNKSDVDLFLNGQCLTVFNATSLDGQLMKENNGVLEYCTDRYKDADDEPVKVDVNPKLPSVICNADFDNALLFNFSTQDNAINFKTKTKLYRFAVKVAKPGECNIVTGDFHIAHYNDSTYKFVNGDADLSTEVKVIEHTEPSAPEFKKGDINGDGKVNGADAGILNRYTSGWDGYADKIKDMSAADINGDGKVNGADSGLLNRYTSGWDGYDKYFN